MQWSPRGSLLTTIHRQGVAVWGGLGWTRMQRLDHGGVHWMDWSPNEKYMITCSTEESSNPRDPTQVLTIPGYHTILVCSPVLWLHSHSRWGRVARPSAPPTRCERMGRDGLIVASERD